MSDISDPVVQEMLSDPAPVEEPAPAEDPAPAPAPEESAPEDPVPAPAPEESAPTTQEVVQNVQEILSSTDTSASGNDLENRVKVLEERLEKLISIFSQARGMINVSGTVNTSKYIIENLP